MNATQPAATRDASVPADVATSEAPTRYQAPALRPEATDRDKRQQARQLIDDDGGATRRLGKQGMV